MGDDLRFVAAGVESTREFGEAAGGFLGEGGPIKRWTKGFGFGEYGPQNS